MATSTSTLFQMTRDAIINSALRKLSVIGEGVVANAQQLSDGAEALNTILADFQSLGMPLWKRTELGITLVNGQSEYVIGTGLAIDTPYPVKLLQANLSLTGSSTRLNMEILARNTFNNLPNVSEGTPVQVSYQPFIESGVLSVWPTPNAGVPVGSQIYITYTAPFYKFTTGTETADIPQEWYNAILFQLALILSDEFSLPLEERSWLEKQSDKRLATALSSSSEDTSVFFYPDRRM